MKNKGYSIERIVILLMLFAFGNILSAQNISINADGTAPDNSAMLDVTSTERGVLIPRMTAAQRLAILSPANGLLVFQTDVPRGFYAYFAATTVWTRLSVDTVLNLERVLNGGNDAAGDFIFNLNRIGVGASTNPRTTVEIDSILTIQGSSVGISYFGSNIYDDGTDIRYLNNGYADAYAISNNISGIFHWTSGASGTTLPGDPTSFIRLEDSAIVMNGDPLGFEIELKGIVIADSLNINENYSFPSVDGTANQILQTDGSGTLNWSNVTGDNLGNHIATTNIELNGNYLSGDGDNEGVFVNNTGQVGVGTNTPLGRMEVAGDGSLIGGLRVSGTTAATVGSSIYLEAASKDWTITATNSGAGAGADKLVFRDYTLAEDRMTIDGTGNVGIGTTFPAVKFHVEGKSLFNNGLQANPVTGVVGGSGDRIILWPGSAVTQPYAIGINANVLWYSGPATSTHRWYIGGTERMSLLSNGNLGLGFATPNTKLQIHATSGAGNLQLTSAVTGTANTDGFIITNDGGSELIMRQNENALWGFITHTGNRAMTISPNAYVGIGTTTPSTQLTVSQSSATPIMDLQSAGSNTLMELNNTGANPATWSFGYLGNTGVNPGFMTFLRGGLHRLVITNNGDVGIGTSTPNAELEVAGDVLIPAVNDYSYRTPKTHYQSFAPNVFNSLLPDQFDFGTFNAATIYAYFRSGGTAFGYATVEVNLPDGADVRELRGWIYDNLVTNPVRVQLMRQQLGTATAQLMVEIESDGPTASTAVQNLSSNTVFNNIIDNANYAYFLRFTGLQNSTESRLYGARITYNVAVTD